MRTGQEPTDADLRHYERLIFKTAQMLASRTEMEAEDIAQLLRIKAWKALRAFDPARCRTTRDKYVFMCIKDQGKDVLKKKRRGELHLEDLLYSASEGSSPDDGISALYEVQKHLTTSHDNVYGAIDEDDVLIPSTVTRIERQVLVLLYTGDYKQGEMAQLLEVDKREIERAIRGLKTKFGDWKPQKASGTTPDIEWAAGLFEGEGGIWSTQSERWGRRSRVGLASTDRDVVERFATVVGFGAIRLERARKSGHNDVWRWASGREGALDLVQQIGPWLGDRRREQFLVAVGVDTPPRIERGWPWAAGLFEGEGCIVLSDHGHRHQAHLNLGMADETEVRDFAKLTGVGTVVGHAGSEPHHKLMWVWRTTGWNRVRAIYHEIQPWLGDRRRFRFQEVLNHQGPGYRPYAVGTDNPGLESLPKAA